MTVPTVLDITFIDHLVLGYGAGPYGAWAYGIGPYYWGSPKQHINIALTEVAMTTPNTTIDSSATVTDQNGTTISNLTAFTLTVTFPDLSTATPSVINEGSGIYTATYATKGPGLVKELWSFTAIGGAVGQEQRTLAIAY